MDTLRPEEPIQLPMDIDIQVVQPDIPMDVDMNDGRNVEVLIEEIERLKSLLSSKNNLLMDSQQREGKKQQIITDLRRDLLLITRKLDRREKRIEELNTEVRQLKSRAPLPFSTNPLIAALFNRSSYKEDNKTLPYEQIIRDFAITLYYKSPCAYESD